jgi:hypothetical protein
MPDPERLAIVKGDARRGPGNVTRFSRTMLTLRAVCLLGLWGCSTGVLSAQHAPSPSSARTALGITWGVTEEGRVTPAWVEAIRNRHDADVIAAIRDSTKRLSEEEARWAGLIQSSVAAWSGWIDSLTIPFQEVTLPGSVSIVLGNVGGQDAFTYGDATIGFDLTRLHSLYGAASTAENKGRIDRFFAHEFTHIAHKAWRRKHGVALDTPLDEALWDCLTEGLGNYRSLSGRWIVEGGVLTTHAQDVLARLQPLFVERLSALAQATDEEAVALMEGLSSGPFDQKWGALTVALWLAQEAKGDDRPLQTWVEAGPWGVVTLAQKYLPEELGSQLSNLNEH